MTYISVTTPTFNRADRLSSLYASLQQQTNRTFEWIIVDDGSTDNTEALCRTWVGKTDCPVRYMRKENGGKHTALNVGIREARGELILLVDSDDTLTADAIAVIRDSWAACDKDDVCGISFLRIRQDGSVIGESFEHDGKYATYIDMRINRRVRGDKAEARRANVLRQFPSRKSKASAS